MHFLENITLEMQHIKLDKRFLYTALFPHSLQNIKLLCYNIYINSYQHSTNNI